MKSFLRLSASVDKMNDRIGNILGVALVLIMLFQVLEVVLRYVFNSPTSWTSEANGMMFTGSAMIAGAYAMLHDTHVRLDIFYRRMSGGAKRVVDLSSAPVVFFVLIVVLWQGLDMAWWAYETEERAYSHLAPLVWPVKACLPLAAALMLLQAIVKYGRILMNTETQAELEPPVIDASDTGDEPREEAAVQEGTT